MKGPRTFVESTYVHQLLVEDLAKVCIHRVGRGKVGNSTEGGGLKPCLKLELVM